MKRTLLVALVVVCAFGNQNCTTTGTVASNPYGLWQPTDAKPGLTPLGPPLHAPDPVVVDAEKTLLIARDTFNLYVHIEREHQDTLAKVSPEFHQFGTKLRGNAIGWLRTADRLKEAYKQNRTAENKALLFTALAVVSKALSETQTMIGKTGLTGS